MHHRSARPNPPTESDIKAAIINELIKRKKIQETTTIISEYFMNDRRKRLDLAVVNEEIWGFEIKTGRDDLGRLLPQITTYLRFCEGVTVVVDPHHLSKARQILPKNVGLWSLEFLSQDISINFVRKTKFRRLNKKEDTLKLLRVEDLQVLLRKHSQTAVSNKRRDLVHKARQLYSTELRSFAVKRIKEKYSTPSGQFWEAIKGKVAKREDIVKLSLYNRTGTKHED